MPADDHRRGETRRALRAVVATPALRRLLGGQSLYLLGGWSITAPLAVLFFERGGAGLVAGAVVARQLPSALAAPLLGAVVDRLPHRTALIATTGGYALGLAAVAVAVLAGAPVGVVIVLYVVAEVSSTAFEPARHATLPVVASDTRQLAAANVVGTGIESSVIFAGPAVGAAILAASGIEAACFAAPVLVAGAVVALAGLRVEPGETEEPAAAPTADADGGGVLSGFGIVWRLHDVRLLLGLAAVQLALDGMLKVFIPVAALELLDMGQPGIGLLNAALGLGAFVGIGLALALAARRPLGWTNFAGQIAYGAAIMLLAAAEAPAVALVLMAVAGAGLALIDTSAMTLLQRATPDGSRGRVFGVAEAVILAASALGAGSAPLLIEALGREGGIVAGGGLVVACAVLALPRLRKLDIAYPIHVPEVVELLRTQPFFGALAPGDLEALADSAERRHVAAGVPIVTQGEAAREWFALLDGTVTVSVDGHAVRTQGPGESFGEIGLLHGVPRTATVVAATDADLVAIDGATFSHVLSGDGAGRDEAIALAATRLAHARPAGVVR